MANMNDVAKMAKVSRGTVSNYINGVKIKDESAKRIESAIKKLNYVPNQAARMLKKNASDTIALILPTIWNPFFSELTNYIQQELKKNNMKMLLCASQDDFNRELDYVQMAKEEKVKGIITISYSNIEPYITSGLPIVSIERYFNQTVPFVTSDNFQGAYLATQEMHKRGVKKPLIILREIPNNLGLFERRNGFIDYCHYAKLDYEVYQDTGDSDSFQERIKTFLLDKYKDKCTYDGIFAATDRYAEYVLNAFADLKWNIPDDVQLVGFDGAKSYEHQTLTISTIMQDIEAIAKKSVEELLNFDKKKTIQAKHILPLKFVPLRTTKKLEK